MIKRYVTITTLFVLIVLISSSALPSRAQTEARLLSDPYLQLPTADSVRVVWFTEFAGQSHTLVYGENLDQNATATTTKMSRMYEDANSRINGRESPEAVTERDVWRHEAVASGLTPNVRVPYRVTSVTDDGTTVSSEQFTLQPLPNPGQGMKILLTSDQQNRLMSPANFQKVIETVGQVDAVFFAGDFVDNPHRASEWFDRYDPTWLDNPGDGTRPAFPGTRPAFFPAMQGNYQELFPEFPYTGGEILQHAPLFGTIGNHETPGRWRPNAQFPLNGITQTATIDFMDNDPQPRWFAEIQYERLKDADPTFNPTDDPTFRERWIRDNSYEFTQYFEMWNHPADGPQGESYWAYQIGDVFVISMNVSRVWRTWNIQEGPAEARFSPRGKFTEFSSELDDPSAWGFGDMWFETYGVESEQYEWLQGVLESEAFKNAKYRVVLGHQTMFGVGDNAVPVMADPIATIRYETSGVTETMTVTWPLDRATWERDIQPLVDAAAIRDITYEYPVANDVWKNDIEPLLLEHNVQLMHTGHSHVWNRALVGDMNYIETSNVGNSFGGYYTDTVGLWKERVSWASSFWNELATPVSRWDAANYPRTGDPHGREPIMPTEFNPMNELEATGRDLPFVDSNNVTAFTIFDTATGTVNSYAFDTRNPENPVRLFDSFTLKAAPRFTSDLTLPRPQLGQPFSFQFTADGEPAPTFTVTAGELPPGLTLSEDGLLSGTPTTNGVYRFTVSADNGFAAPATQEITLSIGERLYLPLIRR